MMAEISFDNLPIEALTCTKHGLIGVVKTALLAAFKRGNFDTCFPYHGHHSLLQPLLTQALEISNTVFEAHSFTL
jgi:hypothetical protein